jgi:hypothetical protein
MYKYALIIITIFLSISIHGQEGKLSEIIISVAEELAAEESAPEAAPLFTEWLQELADNPVNVNSGDESELSRLFFISDFQIKALEDYLRSSGKIVSTFEIANIPGFDKETAELMIPFITLESKITAFTDSSTFRNFFLSNLSIKSSDNDPYAPGSPVKLLTKYKFTSGNISGGVTAEKDQGERFMSGNPQMPDFLSAYLSISGKRFIRSIVIGDYAARFGQGTNINTGIRSGMSLTVPGIISGKDEIKPYTSSDENNYFRGIAAQFQKNSFGLSLFYSVNKIDATLNSTDSLSSDYIDTFYSSGLHNSSTSMLKKDVVNETAIGGNLSYSFSNLKIGLIWTDNRFSLPVIVTGDNPYKIFDFNGEKNQVSTIYYSGLIRRMIFAGEFSADNRGKFALAKRITIRPADRLMINILFRYYEPGYTAFHGNGPGSSSSGENLKGLLGSFTFEAARYLFISAGCDLQYFQWMKYRSSAPSMARREEVKIKYIPSENLTAEFSFYERYSMLNGPESSGIAKLEETISRAIKCTVKYSPFEGLTVGSRVDYKVVDPSGSKGMFLLQDFNYRFKSIPVTMWFRHCIFSTDDWDSRLYTWENDLLYSFSIPALSGEGSRSYLIAGWKIWNDAELRIKYGITTLSENREVLKNTDEFKLQFRIRF